MLPLKTEIHLGAIHKGRPQKTGFLTPPPLSKIFMEKEIFFQILPKILDVLYERLLTKFTLLEIIN